MNSVNSSMETEQVTAANTRYSKNLYTSIWIRFKTSELKDKVPGGALPYKRLMGMCRWMGSHFHDWIDYNGVAFSIELLEWGHTFSDFGG